MLVFTATVFAQLDSVYTKQDVVTGTIVWARQYSLVIYMENSEKKAVSINKIDRLVLNDGEVIIGDEVSNKKYLSYLEKLDVKANAHMDSIHSIIRQSLLARNAAEYTAQTIVQPKSSPQYVQDVDGNSYKTVRIGTQVWMAENLKVTHYRDGTPIPTLIAGEDWASADSGAMCIYKNNGSNEAGIYGALYNWYAAADTRGIAPQGWHIPSDSEWGELETALGITAAEGSFTGVDRREALGGILAGRAELWETGELHKNDHFGQSEFSALPTGYRGYLIGEFGGLGYQCHFWSSTAANTKTAWHRSLTNSQHGISRDRASKNVGFAIRCVKGGKKEYPLKRVAESGEGIEDRAVNTTWNGEMQMGMTDREASLSLGNPQQVNRTEISGIVYARWVYSNGLILFFEDGVLMSFEK